MRESRNILTLILDSEITRYVQNLLLERSHSVLTKYFINNFKTVFLLFHDFFLFSSFLFFFFNYQVCLRPS